MDLNPVGAVLVGARTEAAADGLQIHVVFAVGARAGEARRGVRAVGCGDDAIGHGVGERTMDKVHDTLAGLRACRGGGREHGVGDGAERCCDRHRLEDAMVGRAIGIDQYLQRIEDTGLKPRNAQVNIAAHLRCGALEIHEDLLSRHDDTHDQRDVRRVDAVVVHHIAEAIFAVWQRRDTRAHAALHRFDDLVARLADGAHRPALDDLVAAPDPEHVRRDLRQIVAAPLARHAYVQENQVEDVLFDLALPDDTDGRDPQTFLIDLRHAARHAARRHPADIRVVGNVGDEEDQFALVEDR